ncbi:MAG: low specificity L-threonine aldolase [Alphaproteobacteria bacterium]|nr:low specificity L-threonine aldolase [Alphaproteobacteria bacterium]
MGASFLSDNAAGISPPILEAIAKANAGDAPAYGDDAWTRALDARFADFFGRAAQCFLVGTGTAANALALATLCPPWGAVFCHEEAHVAVDECGAPELFTGGAKLVALPGGDGKLTLDGLRHSLAGFRVGDQHQAQPAAVSLSQSTEAGTVYRPDEIAAIAAWAHEQGLLVHLDGARFANAAVGIGCSPADISWRAGVDILSFSATKNGAFAAEAVIVFDPELAKDLRFRRKRAGHLFSKSRFFAAQFHAYLEDDLWRRNAAHANRMAATLARGLGRLPGVAIAHPVEANEVFVHMPDTLAAFLRQSGFLFHDWPPAGSGKRRLVASPTTAEADVNALLAAAARHA